MLSHLDHSVVSRMPSGEITILEYKDKNEKKTIYMITPTSRLLDISIVDVAVMFCHDRLYVRVGG